MRCVAVLLPLLLGLAAPALAENGVFLSRDETVPARTYRDSDAGELGDEPSTSNWDVFVEETTPPEPERFELPGLFPLLQTTPALQTLVFGPTYRNQKNRTEIGAGLAYVNSRWRFPFELSVEPTWRRNKRIPSDERNTFARVRTFGLVELWDRGSSWESTAFAVTGFWDWQEDSFDNLEFGGSLSQTFGRRLTISGNLAWGGDWPNGGDFNNALFGSVGASYNLGAGLRMGGFYEPDNNYTFEDDFGGFVSYQILPFMELAVNAGKNEFVRVQLMFSYALERP